jgi:replicative DNA helicase Mcm
LTLANGGFVQIDEFDKMDTQTTSSMHEAMEQQTISISKVGVSITLEAQCSILAAANPKYGRYDAELPIGENVDIPPALLSRFDLMFLVRDTVDSSRDVAKAKHILKVFRGGEIDKPLLDKRELTAFLNHVRDLKPKLNQDMEMKIISFYERIRRASSSEVDTLPIGTRQLEAIVRLSQAHAKLYFRDTVVTEDVDCVFDLLKETYKSFEMDIEEGTYNNADITGYSTASLSKEKTANLLWKQCAGEDGKVFMVLFKKELCKSDKFDPDTAQKWIGNWEREGIILQNPDGTWRKAE